MSLTPRPARYAEARVARLNRYRRVGDRQVTSAVIAGMEVRRRVVADHVDAGQRMAAARDFQHSAIRCAGRIGDGRARGVDVDEVNELVVVAAEAGHLASIGAGNGEFEAAGPV